MTTLVEARNGYLEAFERLAGERTEPRWLADARRAAIGRFEEIGFPSPKNEDWKYTSVTPLLAVDFAQAAGAAEHGFDRVRAAARIAALGIRAGDVVCVFVNGRFDAALSRVPAEMPGLVLRSLAEDFTGADSFAASRMGKAFDVGVHGFAALNAAFAEDGLVLHVARGAAIARPVHAVFYAASTAAPTMAATRNVVVCGEDSALTWVEHHVGDDGVHFSNTGSEIVLEKAATLRHVKIQDEGAGTYHVARGHVAVGEGASYRSHVVTLGAVLSRNELAVRLSAARAECRLSGLYVVDGERHADHHLGVDHEVADTKSFQTYKGVLDDEARGVFTGRVLVRRDAQRIEARQTNKTLLLSEGAVAETRPQLEIYADDVQCSHGAAVGRLDADATFYLRQRGLDPAAARALLTWAFADEVLASLPDEMLKAALAQTVHRRLAGSVSVADSLEVVP
jgi:Fe-S cluster assembly protein SufD